jgi:hypothetical protein
MAPAAALAFTAWRRVRTPPLTGTARFDFGIAVSVGSRFSA